MLMLMTLCVTHKSTKTACVIHHPLDVHEGGALDFYVEPADHHHEAIISLLQVIVVNNGVVEQQFALVAT